MHPSMNLKNVVPPRVQEVLTAKKINGPQLSTPIKTTPDRRNKEPALFSDNDGVVLMGVFPGGTNILAVLPS